MEMESTCSVVQAARFYLPLFEYDLFLANINMRKKQEDKRNKILQRHQQALEQHQQALEQQQAREQQQAQEHKSNKIWQQHQRALAQLQAREQQHARQLQQQHGEKKTVTVSTATQTDRCLVCVSLPAFPPRGRSQAVLRELGWSTSRVREDGVTVYTV